ncbi:DUF1993 domain-containing protein [Pelagerythrobacter rhizovicinus]|uniref:DUF1993 domain-containing protein n=1 Tax=Pelagerythrobacter rhizovicinus TaxID=2268576 RepID=A0A4V1QWA7_9SPHN|nr:DUF1993 domain-containing protein [Pelagerythrobacter rhizovicinus]RXZ65496.1 DUF1993 domain-containing protein [Pelagerythrobacter rhizovicinus]
MPLSLHAAFVPSALQMLGATRKLVDKAENWCGEQGCGHDALVGARLADDMLAFDYQVKSVAVHTQGAIEGVRAGVFSPDMSQPPATFDAMRARLDEAVHALEAVQEDEMEGWLGRPMRFAFGERALDFTAEEFLLSFSQPNFYFHAATAYDILRMKGLPLAKRDFMGKLRINRD